MKENNNKISSEVVISVICDFEDCKEKGVSANEFSDSTNLIRDIGVNPEHISNLIDYVESEVKVVVPDDVTEGLENNPVVKDIVKACNTYIYTYVA